MWLMLGCGDPNTNTHTDLHADYSIKASNPQPQKLSATSNMTQNHQVVRVMSEQGRSTSSGGFYNDRRPAAAAPTRSSRWNPTPEQLMTLEDLYRHGLKTPTAQQIRLVTLRLRIFGKIEGKNVFYWFQNHRARERQKRRRELIAMSQSQAQAQAKEPQQPWTNNLISNISLNKESAGEQKRSSLEVEQQKKWTLPNCTLHSDQESSSVPQERMDIVKSNSSRSLGEQSDAAALTSEAQVTNSSARVLYSKLFDYHHCYDYNCGVVLSVLTSPNINEEEERSRKSQTLELFPLESENLKGVKDTELSMIRTASTDTTADFMGDPCFQVL